MGWKGWMGWDEWDGMDGMDLKWYISGYAGRFGQLWDDFYPDISSKKLLLGLNKNLNFLIL